MKGTNDCFDKLANAKMFQLDTFVNFTMLNLLNSGTKTLKIVKINSFEYLYN